MARRLVRLQGNGTLTLPAAVRRRHNLKAGDLVAVEDTDQGVLITRHVGEEPMTTEHEPRFAPPTPEELTQRKAAVDRILALRAKTPSIAPLTTADLVHLSRDDNFWYGEEEPTSSGTVG